MYLYLNIVPRGFLHPSNKRDVTEANDRIGDFHLKQNMHKLRVNSTETNIDRHTIDCSKNYLSQIKCNRWRRSRLRVASCEEGTRNAGSCNTVCNYRTAVTALDFKSSDNPLHTVRWPADPVHCHVVLCTCDLLLTSPPHTIPRIPKTCTSLTIRGIQMVGFVTREHHCIKTEIN